MLCFADDDADEPDMSLIQGWANYYDIIQSPGEKKEGLVWEYRTAFPESSDIKGYIAFLDEKVDVFVDGKLMDRPKTHFS